MQYLLVGLLLLLFIDEVSRLYLWTLMLKDARLTHVRYHSLHTSIRFIQNIDMVSLVDGQFMSL